MLEQPAGRAWPALEREAPGARELSVQDVAALLENVARGAGSPDDVMAAVAEAPAALLELGVPVGVVARVPQARARLEAQADAALAALENAERMWRSVSAMRAVLLAQAYAWQMLSCRLADGRMAEDGPLHRRVAVAELAGVLGLSEQTVAGMVPDAVAVAFDRPVLAAAMHDGTLSWAHAQVLLEHTRDLPPDAQQDADRVLVPRGGGTTRSRFGAIVRRWRERHHPRPVLERHEEARAKRHVQLCPAGDGMAWLTAFLPAVQAHAIFQGLDAAARAVAGPAAARDARTLEQLRADALVDRLLGGGPQVSDDDDRPDRDRGDHRQGRNGTRDRGRTTPTGRFPWPQVQVQVVLTVPIGTALGGTQPGHLAGYGPLDPVTTRQLLGGASCFTRVLTDPVTGDVRALDGTSYRPPAALRRFLQVRDGTCRFPGCGRTITGCDTDHVRDWAHGGPTTEGNLHHLCRHHHRLKHLSRWSAALHPDGRCTWRSPRGRTYTTEPAWTPEPDAPPTPDDAATTSGPPDRPAVRSYLPGPDDEPPF